MNHFIHVVKWIEAQDTGLEPVALLKELRKTAGLDSSFIQHYLGGLDQRSSRLVTNSTVTEYLSTAIHHMVTESGVEKGVVLTSDGTTVALAPLLLGIEAGLQSVSKGRVRGLYPLALAKTLAASFLHRSRSSSTAHRLGSDGCWDNVSSPKVFTLADVASLVTDAQVNGGMDGVILGMKVADPSRHRAKLSTLLMQYYRQRVNGLDSAPRLISPRRRQNFKRLSRPGFLKKQVMGTLAVYQKLNKGQGKQRKTNKETLERIVREGINAFEHRYTGKWKYQLLWQLVSKQI